MEQIITGTEHGTEYAVELERNIERNMLWNVFGNKYRNPGMIAPSLGGYMIAIHAF